MITSLCWRDRHAPAQPQLVRRLSPPHSADPGHGRPQRLAREHAALRRRWRAHGGAVYRPQLARAVLSRLLGRGAGATVAEPLDALAVAQPSPTRIGVRGLTRPACAGTRRVCAP